MKYKCNCFLHFYNGSASYVREKQIEVEAENEQEAESIAIREVRDMHRYHHNSLDSIAVKFITPLEITSESAYPEMKEPTGEINLNELHQFLWAWYYEEYGRRELDTLTKEQARALYDSMVVINKIKKGLVESGAQTVPINDTSQRP